MNKSIEKMMGDLRGIAIRVGPMVAMRWGLALILKLPSIIRTRNLQAADLLMGVGPFHVFYTSSVDFYILGSGAFSGIREMYVRDTYLHGGALAIEDGDVVVDLGANMGNFSNLALAHGQNVRVVAVEPNRDLNEVWKSSLGLNDGFLERAILVSGFIGMKGALQDQLMQDDRYREADWLSEEEFIDIAKLTKIDFLKCDIEGAEYGLLRPGGMLLNMVRKIAVEIHAFAGDVGGFQDMLRSEGFAIRYVQSDPDGTATVLAERKLQDPQLAASV